MSSFKLCFVATICVLLTRNQYAKADGNPAANATTNSTCAFVTDYSTIEAAIRSSIFLGDDEGTANLLRSRQLFEVAAGYTYRDNETCLVTQNEDNRGQDPDIVAMRALAIHAERYRQDTLYMARAMVQSFELECQCSLFTAQEKDEMVRNIKEVLDDPEEREAIMNYGRENQDDDNDDDNVVSTPRVIIVRRSSDEGSRRRVVRVRPTVVSDEDDEDESEGRIVFVPRSSGGSSEPDVDVKPSPIDDGDEREGGDFGSSDGYRRRLKVTESSPTNSFFCAYCDPPRACRRSGLRWCQ